MKLKTFYSLFYALSQYLIQKDFLRKPEASRSVDQGRENAQPGSHNIFNLL